jgi:hypothetical protein
MTTLYGDNNKKIQFSISNTIHECDSDMYTIESPTIVCNNKKDAERIQNELGSFVSKLSRTILENK